MAGFTLLIAFLSLIALMIIHEFGHFIIAKKFGVRVEEFGIGYPPRIFGKQLGETFYSVNLVPLGAFVKIYGEEGGVDDYRSFSSLAIWKRILIVLGGVLAFWVASIIIFSVVFVTGVSVPVGDDDIQGIGATDLVISSVQENSPASAAGFKTGDTIVSLQTGERTLLVNKIGDFQEFVKSSDGSPIIVTIERGGKPTALMATPRVNPPPDQGPLGVTLERFGNIIPKTPWYEAPVRGTLYTGEITLKSIGGIWTVLSDLFRGNGVPQGAELAGPIGITIFLANAASYGPGFFLYFIGAISVFIALFNLFPIPALDGGKLMFLIIEKIIRRPVSVKWEQGLTIFFFIILITMSLIITVAFDIPRIVDFWKAGL